MKRMVDSYDTLYKMESAQFEQMILDDFSYIHTFLSTLSATAIENNIFPKWSNPIQFYKGP